MGGKIDGMGGKSNFGRFPPSRHVMSFEILHSELKGCLERSPMHTAKGNPVVLEHQGILYALANSTRTPGHDYFESYNPVKDEWDILESPPFYNQKSKYYVVRPSHLSYFFMDDKIYMSVGYDAAFTYDINGKKWEPCYMFSDFLDPWSPHFRSMLFGGIYESAEERNLGFYFMGEAVVVEEANDRYSISTLPRGLVVAYAISNGK